MCLQIIVCRFVILYFLSYDSFISNFAKRKPNHFRQIFNVDSNVEFNDILIK